MTESTALGELTGFECLEEGYRYVDRILEVIGDGTLFGNFDREGIEALVRYLKFYRVPAGREIIREGLRGDFMLLVVEGTLEILKTDPRGLPQRLNLVGPGKMLGEMSLIDGEPRFASCVTLEPTVIAVLDRDTLVRIVTESSPIGVKLLMELLVLLNQRLRGVTGELMKCKENQRLRIH